MPPRGRKPRAESVERHKATFAAKLGSPRDRLMRYVEPDLNTGCWIWAGTMLATGYGQIVVMGRTVSAHRLSYEVHHGAIGDGMFVCHRCDTPACVNPDHLFLGTNSDNIRDAVAKGRINALVGEAHPKVKLTEADIPRILARLLMGEACATIAADYGVTDCAINAIRRGKSWNHITGLPKVRGIDDGKGAGGSNVARRAA